MGKISAIGYQVANHDLAELFEWSKLRNALSHQPPEMYNPVSICEADIIEYIVLLKRIIEVLHFQRESYVEKSVNNSEDKKGSSSVK